MANRQPAINDQPESGLNRQDREQQILQAALEVFSHKGFEGSRTKEIAKQAGVSEALVFKYFPSKKDLLLAIARPIQKLMQPVFMDGLRKRLEELQDAPLETILLEVIRDRMELLDKHRNLVLTLITEAIHKPEIMAMLQEIIMPKVQQLVELALAPARKRGELRIVDTATLSRSFLSLVIGLVVLPRIQPDLYGNPSDSALPTATVDLFLHGIRNPLPPKGGQA